MVLLQMVALRSRDLTCITPWPTADGCEASGILTSHPCLPDSLLPQPQHHPLWPWTPSPCPSSGASKIPPALAPESYSYHRGPSDPIVSPGPQLWPSLALILAPGDNASTSPPSPALGDAWGHGQACGRRGLGMLRDLTTISHPGPGDFQTPRGLARRESLPAQL